eukprot:1151274-Pyramimonas_sp.AAC.1
MHFPAVVEAIMRVEEPQSGKGGRADRFGDVRGAFRGRAIPELALMRTPIATALPGHAGDSQFGGVAGRGVDLAGLAMRTYQNIAELQPVSYTHLRAHETGAYL